MFIVYTLLCSLIILVCLALFCVFDFNRQNTRRSQQQDELVHQLSSQLFQGIDTLKQSLFELEKNTKDSLDTSISTSQRQSTQMILDQQHRNHHIISEISGKLQHLNHWQRDIVDLNQRIGKLGKILDNTNLKGKFGEMQLEVLLRNILPSTWIKSQHQLPTGARVDFMIDTSQHTLCLCIDSKFPVQSYRLLIDYPENKQYVKDFIQVIKKNIQDISEKYIIPQVTLDFALLFVPSDAIFSQILLFEDLMSFAQDKKVLLCSPQTLHWQLLLLKKMVIEFGINDFIESKGHLVNQFVQEHEKILDKVQLIEKKTLHIQRDLSSISLTVQKQMKFIEGLLEVEKNCE